MNGQTAQERRVSPRIDFQGVVLVRTARKQIPCQALNLSESGILVRPTGRGNPGSQFRVTFSLPDGPGWVDLEGKLVHRTWIEQRISWGIRFSGVPAVVQSKLRRFVHTVDEPVRPVQGPRASRELRLDPEPSLRSAEVAVQVTEHGDEKDEGPTRRVTATRLKQLAGEEDTRQISRTELERLMSLIAKPDE